MDLDQVTLSSYSISRIEKDSYPILQLATKDVPKDSGVDKAIDKCKNLASTVQYSSWVFQVNSYFFLPSTKNFLFNFDRLLPDPSRSTSPWTQLAEWQ